MSIDELIERLRYRFNDYWYSEKRSVKLLARALAFTLFAAVISTIAPTLADELSSDPQMLEPVVAPIETSTTTVLPDETATATPSAAPTFSPEPQITRSATTPGSDDPLADNSDTSTANMPGEPFENQPKYVVKVPQSGALDPRATAYFLPHIYAATSDPDVEYTMACINSSSGVHFDALHKGASDNADEGNELIAGDRTGFLVISAQTERVIALINSYNGLFLTSASGGLSGRSLTVRFVAVTKAVANPDYCSAAKSGAIMTLRPLGLVLSTVKGGGALK